MNIQEHDDNVFTKERTSLEQYLMRIIQRYFDIENNYTKSSIESIIVESITRFKRLCLDKNDGFVFSINNKTGNISFDINTINGEYKFNKRTSFNKNFGTEEDTICEGNDIRLNDDRIANAHVHTVEDIVGLEEELMNINAPNITHNHANGHILDIIRYSGNKNEFDLIILENIKKQFYLCETMIINIESEIHKYKFNDVDTLADSVALVKRRAEAISNSDELINKWVNEINIIINNYKEELDNKMSLVLETLITKEDFNETKNEMNKVYNITLTGNKTFEINYRNAMIKADNEKFNTFIKTSPQLITNTKGDVRLYFAYTDDNGNIIKNHLPFIIDNGDDKIIIQGFKDKDNNVYVETTLNNNIYGIGYLKNDTLIFSSFGMNLNITETLDYISDKNIQLLKYNPSDSIQANIIKEITEPVVNGQKLKTNLKYFINAIKNNDSYNTIDNGTVDFLETDIIETRNTDNYLCYYASKNITEGLYSISDTDKIEFFGEYTLPKISNFYNNPSIYYEVFSKGEDE